jgi:endonuclease III
MERSDVAVDVHVRRVFLRSGLVESDDPVSIILAARELWPDPPAALDSPAWNVGITWCRPTAPECSA